ncbi:MAG: hypothetical protein ACNYWU_02150 [Desulfobacterales bacterium]
MRELNAKEKDLLHRVETKPVLQPFFFRKLKGLHWFEPLYERGFFKPENNPELVPAKEEGYVNIPTWPVTEYLVATSKELSDPAKEDYAVKFIDLLKEITSYAKKENFSNYRTWWQLVKVIRNIPTHLISLEDIDLIDYWLDDPYERGLVAEQVGEKWLPDLLEKSDEHCNQIALRLLDILYKVNFIDKKYGSHEKKKPVLRYTSHYAKKITKNVAGLSGLKLGLSAVEFFQSRLISILDELKNDTWSSIWRPAIEEDDEQNRGRHDAGNILIAAYRDCLLGVVDKDVAASSAHLLSLFDCQYQTLKRLAIYTIDKNFEALKNICDPILASEFFHDNFRHELWHFLNNYYREFVSDQKTKVMDIIEGMEIHDDEGNIEVGPTAYKRAIWLAAIKDFDEQTSQPYEKYTDIIGVQPEHPDFSSYMTAGWVDHKSPIPIEHLLSLNVDALIEAVNTYEDPGRFREPGLEGLVKCFKDVVKTKAKEFYLELMKFIDSDLAFVYPLIEAYRELWSEKKELPWRAVWPSLLDFCSELVERENFWAEENSRSRSHFIANRHSIVGAIAELIEGGTKSDNHAFDKSLMPKAKQILLILLDRQEGEEFKHDSNAVSIAINSSRGRCIEALINLSLRSCRITNKKHGEHSQAWRQFEDIYTSELKRNERGEYEFATLVANFLPNFLYMSSEWTRSNLANIFDYSDYQKWLCAMQGYAYVGAVYDDVYNHLKANEDLLKALDDENIKDRVEEKIIQNIVVSYIQGNEDINKTESLISILINRKDYSELSQLISFIWTLRKKDDDKLREKVFELWPKLLGIIDFESREGKKLASQLCSWAAFIDEIDATTESWLLQIAQYAEEDYNSYDLLESLAWISESQALEAQKVWLKMLDSYSYDYPDDAIRQILKNLIVLGPEGKRKAKEVVDAYLRHGIERPRTWLEEIKGSIINS